MTDLEKLAVNAVEAKKALLGNKDPDQSGRLGMALRVATQSFKDAVTPELILTLTTRNREMEEALKKIKNIYGKNTFAGKVARKALTSQGEKP